MSIEKDFSRNVWCFLGLPLDAVSLPQAAEEIISAINSRQPCFLSTPNLNYLCTAQSDPVFLNSVINSDLSICDGFPVVLAANLLNIPLPERVAGSDLIDFLYESKREKPLKIFFFGGEAGVGELACQKINASNKGLTAVGYYTPGFGSVEDMSKPEIIAYLNQHEIDILIVAISAKKGQYWIERNKALLNATVYSHLGAVINFYAGSVERAPVIFRRIGMEWLWRIYQEPSLWRRYYNDGKTFLRLLFTHVLPYGYWLKVNAHKIVIQPLTITTTVTNKNIKHIKLNGSATHAALASLRTAFKQSALEPLDLIIDLKEVNLIDSAFLGLCLILHKHIKASGQTMSLHNANPTISRIIKWHNLDYLINP